MGWPLFRFILDLCPTQTPHRSSTPFSRLWRRHLFFSASRITHISKPSPMEVMQFKKPHTLVGILFYQKRMWHWYIHRLRVDFCATLLQPSWHGISPTQERPGREWHYSCRGAQQYQAPLPRGDLHAGEYCASHPRLSWAGKDAEFMHTIKKFIAAPRSNCSMLTLQWSIILPLMRHHNWCMA